MLFYLKNNILVHNCTTIRGDTLANLRVGTPANPVTTSRQACRRFSRRSSHPKAAESTTQEPPGPVRLLPTNGWTPLSCDPLTVKVVNDPKIV